MILQTESGQWIDDDECVTTCKDGDEKDIKILKESQQVLIIIIIIIIIAIIIIMIIIIIIIKELFNRENLASMTDVHPNSYEYKILLPKFLIELEKST